MWWWKVSVTEVLYFFLSFQETAGWRALSSLPICWISFLHDPRPWELLQSLPLQWQSHTKREDGEHFLTDHSWFIITLWVIINKWDGEQGVVGVYMRLLQQCNVVRTRLSKGAQLPAQLWTREPGACWTLGHSVAYGRVDGINRTSVSVRMCESCCNMFCFVFSVLFLVRGFAALFLGPSPTRKGSTVVHTHRISFPLTSCKCVVSELTQANS